MTEQKNTKPVIEITGKAVYPIAVNQPALISESGGHTRRTSTVISVDVISDSETHFETKNSIYHLRAKPQEPLAAVMLKKMFEMRERK